MRSGCTEESLEDEKSRALAASGVSGVNPRDWYVIRPLVCTTTHLM